MTNTIKFSEFTQSTLTNSSNDLVGTDGTHNIKQPSTISWSTANRPSPPYSGLLGYNTDNAAYEYWNGSAWVTFAAGGSGTVNLGAQYQLAYYPANGTGVSGLMSANNAVLSTDGSGIPSWSTTLPSGLTIPIPNISGVTNGSSASAGYVGEFLSSVISYASAVTLGSNIASNVTTLSLSAGDWDVWGNVTLRTGGTSPSGIIAWVSTASATFPDPSLINGIILGSGAITQTCGATATMQRFNLTTTTTIYLSAELINSSGSGSACGGIYARRRR